MVELPADTVKTAAVVIIGNEILSGKTCDANLAFLGSRLSDLGIELREARVVPDEERAIIDTVNECRSRYSYVFTTGGIGPTHDDITSATIARCFNVPLSRNGKAVACLENYYKNGDINDARLKMADIPEGAELIINPVSGAPGFHLENVFVLPGIPVIMQAMFDGITDRLVGGPPIISHSIATNLREGIIAGGLGKIQENYPQVRIGSYPFFRGGLLGVNLVMRSTNQEMLDSAAKDITKLINDLSGRILQVE